MQKQDGENQQEATFVFSGEGHTIGNSLRHLLMKDANVDFCGYSVPHPLEDKMNVRVQTRNPDYSAVDALKTGLRNLKAICEAVKTEFTDKVADHAADEE